MRTHDGSGDTYPAGPALGRDSCRIRRLMCLQFDGDGFAVPSPSKLKVALAVTVLVLACYGLIA